MATKEHENNDRTHKSQMNSQKIQNSHRSSINTAHQLKSAPTYLALIWEEHRGDLATIFVPRGFSIFSGGSKYPDPFTARQPVQSARVEVQQKVRKGDP